MNLHKSNFIGNIARNTGPFLSHLLLGNRRVQFTRKILAYLNYLMGKGSGTGAELRSEVAIAKKVIFRDDPIIFDVGGNIGIWSIYLREILHSGHIFIFEPQPVCQQHIVKAKIQGSSLICAAVGETKGLLNLYSSSETDGSASLHARNDSYFQDKEYQSSTVNVIKLDDFIAEHKLGFIDYIKFDIEGHEFFALKGLAHTLTSQQIGAMSFEFGSGNLNSRTCFRDFWKMLNEDFYIYRMTPSCSLIQISSYYEDLEYYRGVTNYLAILKNHPFQSSNASAVSAIHEG